MYKPKICSIELFRKCCLRCRMCLMWNVKEDRILLDKKILKLLAGQLAVVMEGQKEVVLSGGEPLLHPQIFDIVKIFAKRKLKVGMASNGVLIDKGKAKKLVAAGLKNIQLSLDSFNKETHDFLRGVEGAHDRVLAAAGYLSAYPDTLSVCAQTVISGRNIHEIPETIEFVRSSGRFQAISFMAVTEPFFGPDDKNWRTSADFSFLWPTDLELVDKTIDRIIRMKKDGYPIANPEAQFELFRSYFHDPCKRKEGVTCKLGEYVLSIDPAGDARVCCFMAALGNIGTSKVADLLALKGLDETRREMLVCNRVCNTIVNCFFKE